MTAIRTDISDYIYRYISHCFNEYVCLKSKFRRILMFCFWHGKQHILDLKSFMEVFPFKNSLPTKTCSIWYKIHLYLKNYISFRPTWLASLIFLQQLLKGANLKMALSFFFLGTILEERNCLIVDLLHIDVSTKSL